MAIAKTRTPPTSGRVRTWAIFLQQRSRRMPLEDALANAQEAPATPLIDAATWRSAGAP
jgi:hypothetical protein